MTGGAPTLTRWRRSPSVLWRSTSSGVVLLLPGATEPVVLSPPGDQLWKLLTTPIDLATLTDLLATSYGADPAEVASDLDVVLADLVRNGAVEELVTGGRQG